MTRIIPWHIPHIEQLSGVNSSLLYPDLAVNLFATSIIHTVPMSWERPTIDGCTSPDIRESLRALVEMISRSTCILATYERSRTRI